MHSPILTQFATSETLGGAEITVSVTLYECGASKHTREAIACGADDVLARAATAAIRQQLPMLRRAAQEAVSDLARKIADTNRQDIIDHARNQGKHEASSELTDEHAATVKAKDSKIEALEAEIMALREAAKGQVIGKVSRTRSAPRRTTRKAVRK